MSSQKLRIVIGSSNVFGADWIPTDIDQLNLLVDGDWRKLFRRNSIDAMLAEHVWEHLTPEQAPIAARQCHAYLKEGGYLRIAVPDGNHPSYEYREAVKPGGHGDGSDDHKVLYTIDSLVRLFENSGFKVNKLEYFDSQGIFHGSQWAVDMGKIWRSLKFDERNVDGNPNYTSIIIDAIKR